MKDPLYILLLCDGNAEDPHGAFSGSAHSLVTEFRRQGHRVRTAGLELGGIPRWVSAALAFSPDRARWGVRYRLGAPGFYFRSRRAAKSIRARGPHTRVVLQIGATFRPAGIGGLPYFLYCDSNIRMAEEGIATGVSEAASLSQGELAAVAARELGVYRGATGIFTLSERLRRTFLSGFGIAPERVLACYAGPNFALDTIPSTPTSHRGPPTILFVGKQFDRKGGDLLLQAFETVRLELPDARLVIVGPPDLRVDCPGAENLGYLRRDRPQEWARLRQAYLEADVFCLPTRFEPFGIAFLEAMFFGLPCIGPNAWAIPEIIQQGETGFLVEPENPSALATAILRVLEHPEEARALGEAGRRRAVTTFTWEATVRRMVSRMAPFAANR